MPTSWALPDLLATPDVAATASVAELQQAAVDLLATADGVVVESQRALVEAATSAGPVTVGSASVDRDRVTASLAVAVPAADDQVVLRILAASESIGPSVDSLAITATVTGSDVTTTVEPELDRVVVDLGAAAPDGVVLHLDVAYDLPAAEDLAAGGGPAGYGLLADHGDVVTLGHWLPAVVAVPDNDGAVPQWGDLGAFAAGTWVVDVTVPEGTLRTGAVDRATPEGTVRALGFGLRDLAATWFPDGATPTTVAGDGAAAPVVVATSDDGSDDRPVAQVSHDQLVAYAERWGDLPWPELDLVRAPILPAAGMEFPGLVIEDTEYWQPTDVGTEFTLAHEWAHQYFHALVGNGSLSDPVVDEPLAQYLTWRWFLAQDGQAFADGLAARSLSDEGQPDRVAPAQAAADFPDGSTYSVAIYRTAATAWVDAAEAHGVDVVDDAIRQVIADHALGVADVESLLASVEQVSPAVAEDLREAFSTAPG
ncbi:hypothetical protein [Salsipaludibacter albus]|uniref:hypothetical protein n=1 Tax=Salsipaludibacter albus TaxID=2849650 RepID=UPI001EE4EB33|nr:hypothetical protein [Salsipaludibacter albus]MBY5161711.1 hypothetical protein [Salsipaludibacter albus]